MLFDTHSICLPYSSICEGQGPRSVSFDSVKSQNLPERKNVRSKSFIYIFFIYLFIFFAFVLTVCFSWCCDLGRRSPLRLNTADFESPCGIWGTPGTSTWPVILYWHRRMSHKLRNFCWLFNIIKNETGPTKARKNSDKQH